MKLQFFYSTNNPNTMEVYSSRLLSTLEDRDAFYHAMSFVTHELTDKDLEIFAAHLPEQRRFNAALKHISNLHKRITNTIKNDTSDYVAYLNGYLALESTIIEFNNVLSNIVNNFPSWNREYKYNILKDKLEFVYIVKENLKKAKAMQDTQTNQTNQINQIRSGPQLPHTYYTL